VETVEPARLRAAAGAPLTRREFAAASAAGLLAFRQPKRAVTIGVQSYSFRDRTLEEAIAAMKKIGLTSCELWQSHVEQPVLPRRMPREELRKWRETVSLDVFHRVRDQFAKAKISLSAYNISIQDGFSEIELERAFDMTAALGAPLITSSSNVKTVARIAPVAEKRRMLVGMHNHSRIDPNEFATAASLSNALRQGQYIAVNLDVGHFTAANEDAVEFLRQHHARIVTLHIKDRKRDQGAHVPLGTGDAPNAQVLELVRDNGWPIPMNLEYEYKGGDTVEEVRRMLDYCKRALNL
jgi:sugar phosphate isomerase/epimerase